MNYYYITGTSRGIGKAISEELLGDSTNFVYGISRSEVIKHANYQHISMDLNNLEVVSAYKFEQHPGADKICLINNAGMLGHIKHIGAKDNGRIIQSYNVNLVAPVLFTNNFMKKYKKSDAEIIVLNISSGAARHVVNSWSTYCSTKAGLEMFAQVLAGEQKELGKTNVHIYSVAPGIVDTQMQDEIRETGPDDFSNLDKFVKLKENNQLATTVDVAKRITDILDHPTDYQELIMDLRDM